MRYLVKLTPVFILFVLDWFLIAALMEILFVGFRNYYDNEQYFTFKFENYLETLFTVFVFFTGNNSPDIYLKEFPQNAVLTFTIIFIIWLNNLVLLATIIGLSQHQIEEEQKNNMETILKHDFKKKVLIQLQTLPNASYSFIKRYIKSVKHENESIDIVNENFLLNIHLQDEKLQEAS